MNNEVPRSPSNNKVDPKLSQFTEELNELLDRYQYQLKPQLTINSNGILPAVSIVNKIPPRKPVKKASKPKKRKKK